MTENEFFERLRHDARPLRYQPDEYLATRISARVRERISAPTPMTFLARWFRPLGASLVATTLAATLGIAWMDRATTDAQPSIESLAATNTIEISVGGDVYRVDR